MFETMRRLHPRQPFLFYRELIYPVKEKEIHVGRKRIDIKFTNAAEDGFFLRMAQAHQTRALNIPFECKNYSSDINNPEFDQLSSRFGHQRGFFGIILCRSIDDRQRVINACRDAANDGRGYILVLGDAHIVAMLERVEAENAASWIGFCRLDLMKFLISDHSPAAATNSPRNHAWAGSLVVRRCQAIEMVAEKSTGSGIVASSAWAAMRLAARLGMVAIRSEAASAAGTAR
jgi:hypothetical protein